MSSRWTALWAGAIAAGALAASAAHASLIGDQVLITEYYPNLSTQFGGSAGPMVIPPGGWNTGAGFSNISITVDGSSITLAGSGTYNAAAFNGFDIQDLNPKTRITSAVLDSSSLPLPAGDLFFDQHNVWINVENVDVTKDIVVDLASTGVPEPQSWALMLIGVCGVGWVARRRRPGTYFSRGFRPITPAAGS